MYGYAGLCFGARKRRMTCEMLEKAGQTVSREKSENLGDSHTETSISRVIYLWRTILRYVQESQAGMMSKEEGDDTVTHSTAINMTQYFLLIYAPPFPPFQGDVNRGGHADQQIEAKKCSDTALGRRLSVLSTVFEA